MASDPNTLLAEVACFECAGDPGLFQLYKIALLRQILLAADPTAMTDPNTLMAQIPCYACLPPGQLQLIEIALLAQIAAGGGGGGGGLACGNGPPVAPPAGLCGGYVDMLAGTLYLYYGGAWTLFAAGGGGQLVLYTTTDPTTDGVTPADINQPAFAYKASGAGPTFVWDPVGHAWN